MAVPNSRRMSGGHTRSSQRQTGIDVRRPMVWPWNGPGPSAKGMGNTTSERCAGAGGSSAMPAWTVGGTLGWHNYSRDDGSSCSMPIGLRGVAGGRIHPDGTACGLAMLVGKPPALAGPPPVVAVRSVKGAPDAEGDDGDGNPWSNVVVGRQWLFLGNADWHPFSTPAPSPR